METSETKPLRAVPLQRLVRPRWVDTCTCIRVAVEVSPCRQNESPDSYRHRWKQTVQSAYERGADWNYDADCPLCYCGDISGTNAESIHPESKPNDHE